MELKPGYKQTEVGVIPEDWRVTLLPEVCKFRGGKAHEHHISDLGKYVCVNPKFISSDGAVRKYSTANFCPAKKGDVLMVMSDLPNGRALAKTYLVEEDSKYAVNQRVCTLTAYRDAPEYLFYVLNRSPYFLKFNDGVNQTNLLNPVFQKCLLALPPTVEEQRAIASALSDVDALLGGLDRLIAKKHDLKQAAMQQLLTGQTRLPGFHDEWEVKRLDMVADVLKGSGLSKSQTTSSGVRPCILYGELFTAYGRIIADVVGRTNSIDGCNSQQGDVLMPGSTTTTGSDLAIASALLVDGVALGGDIIIIRRKDDSYDSVFLANYLTHAKKQEIAEFTQGITIHHLYGKNMRGLSLDLPHPSEQTAIATVLSDMDAELTALEARRDKTRDIKQAMMQELLTGKTRLVTPEVPHA